MCISGAQIILSLFFSSGVDLLLLHRSSMPTLMWDGMCVRWEFMRNQSYVKTQGAALLAHPIPPWISRRRHLSHCPQVGHLGHIGHIGQIGHIGHIDCLVTLDKPARLSFSCSLDLLLNEISIKQIQLEISETAIGCLGHTYHISRLGRLGHLDHLVTLVTAPICFPH